MARKLSRRLLAEYVAQQLLSDSNQPRSRVIQQLAAYLIDTRRTDEAGLIIRDVDHFLASQGHVNVQVTAAFDLSAETQKAIQKLVRVHTQAKTLQVDTSIDPAVLGGARIDIPGRQLDQTILHQLTTFRTANRKA